MLKNIIYNIKNNDGHHLSNKIDCYSKNVPLLKYKIKYYFYLFIYFSICHKS